MTEKLYYENPYICEGHGEVLEIIEKSNKFEIVLDKTLFYPEGGGQPCDFGFIDDLKIEYVYEKDDIIYHVAEAKPSNKIVNCKVDFNRRVEHMQQHSGEHLLAAAVFKLYKGVNHGFHMGEEYSTLDINIADITEEMLENIEKEANSYIYKNAEVITYTLPKEEANKLPLRKEIVAHGNIRIVQMGEIDYTACCGTQVLRTGEVGIIKIVKTEKYKGMTRLYFKCGERAFKDYSKKQNIISKVSRYLSVDESDVFSKVTSQGEENASLKKQIAEMKKAFAKNEADELMNNAESKVINVNYLDKSFEEIENVYEIVSEKQYIALIASAMDKKVIFGHNGSFDVNCGKIFKENIKEYNGRGGGSNKRAQGAFTSEEDMMAFINKIKEEL